MRASRPLYLALASIVSVGPVLATEPAVGWSLPFLGKTYCPADAPAALTCDVRVLPDGAYVVLGQTVCVDDVRGVACDVRLRSTPADDDGVSRWLRDLAARFSDDANGKAVH